MHRGKHEVASLLAPVTLRSGAKRKRDGKSRHGEGPSKSWAEELCDELVAEEEAEQKNKNKSTTRPSSRASVALAAGRGLSASEKKRERAYQRQLAALAQSRLPGSAFSALDHASSDADSAASDASGSDDILGEIDDLINEQDELAAEDDERRDQIEEQIESEEYYRAQAFGSDSDYEKDNKDKGNEEEEFDDDDNDDDDVGSEDDEDAKNFSFGFFERISQKKTAKSTNTAKDKKMHKVVPRTTHSSKKSNDKAVNIFPPLPRSGEKNKGLSKELERLAKDAAEANQKQQPTKTPKKKRKREG